VNKDDIDLRDRRKGDHIILIWLWRVLSGLMSVLLIVVCAFVARFSQQVEKNQINLIEMEKRHTAEMAEMRLNVSGIELTRFTEAEGDTLKSLITTNQLDIMRELFSIREEIAKLPPKEWQDRIISLEKLVNRMRGTS